MNMKEMGKRARHRRRSLGLTCRDVGKMVGIATGNISKFEMGRLKKAPTYLHKLLKAMDVTMDYFQMEEIMDKP